MAEPTAQQRGEAATADMDDFVDHEATFDKQQTDTSVALAEALLVVRSLDSNDFLTMTEEAIAEMRKTFERARTLLGTFGTTCYVHGQFARRVAKAAADAPDDIHDGFVNRR